MPTDVDKENLEQLQQRVASIPNIEDPMWLDASQEDWNAVENKGPFDLIIAINCIHVSPRALHLQLFQKSKKLLNVGGWLFIYAACKVDGEYTSESNKSFDEMLRSTNPEYGLRDVKDMQRLAAENGLECVTVSEMPAANTALLFRKQ